MVGRGGGGRGKVQGHKLADMLVLVTNQKPDPATSLAICVLSDMLVLVTNQKPDPATSLAICVLSDMLVLVAGSGF